MKAVRLFLIGFFLFCGVFEVSAKKNDFKVNAKVDQRVELMSIVARLADYQEYKNNQFKSYAEDVDKHFAKHKNHPVIKLAIKLRKENGVSYDAVASMAVHLKSDLTPKLQFSDVAPDSRWGRKDALHFTKLLRDFYKDADCKEFFKSHADTYKTVENRFQKLLTKVDFDWYKRFYGEVPNGSFNLYIGLLNGGGNFGPKVVYPNEEEDLYAIIGAWQMDKEGIPIFNDRNLPTIIHEYNHSFINHLVRANYDELKTSGEQVYAPVADKMIKLAYGNWETTMLESLVRSAVIRYLIEHDEKLAKRALESDRARGFIWIKELSVLMGIYENNRKNHPTFRSFMPFVIAYYADLAKRIDKKLNILKKANHKLLQLRNLKMVLSRLIQKSRK